MQTVSARGRHGSRLARHRARAQARRIPARARM